MVSNDKEVGVEVEGVLNLLSMVTHKTAQSKGFLEAKNECPRELLFAAAHMGLICSEACEALEVIRKGDLQAPSQKVPGITALEDELADIVIRTVMIAKELGVDIGKGVVTKHHFNNARPKMHGGKMF